MNMEVEFNIHNHTVKRLYWPGGGAAVAGGAQRGRPMHEGLRARAAWGNHPKTPANAPKLLEMPKLALGALGGQP